MAPLEAIIVTFVNRIDRRTNVVHLSIKMKNWNKHLGLPSANWRWCVLEQYPRTGCTNTTYLPSTGLISPLTGYTVTWTYSTLCRWQLVCFLCSTMSFHAGRIDRGWVAFSNGYNLPNPTQQVPGASPSLQLQSSFNSEFREKADLSSQVEKNQS